MKLKISATKLTLFAALVLLQLSCQDKQQVEETDRNAQATTLSGDATSGLGLTREQAIAEINARKDSIKSRYESLSRERDRNNKLTTELLSDGSNGCWADKKIEQMEILVKGAHIDRKYIGRSGSPRTTKQGHPWTMTFQFGANMAVINDEESNAMFIPGGRKVITDFADLKISEIEYLKIAKGGSQYDAERKCKKKNFGLSEKCNYENFEEARMELDEIEIKINGETFYKRTAISYVFEANKLEWSEEALKANEKYLELMNRTDCGQ